MPILHPDSFSRAAHSLRRWWCSTHRAAQLGWGMQGSGEQLSVSPTTAETRYDTPSFLARFIELDAV